MNGKRPTAPDQVEIDRLLSPDQDAIAAGA
jgi:hypothetical protein